MSLWRGRYIVYRCLSGSQSVTFRPVARRWRLKAALALASDIAFEGGSDLVQVNWRTGRRTSRSVHIAGFKPFERPEQSVTVTYRADPGAVAKVAAGYAQRRRSVVLPDDTSCTGYDEDGNACPDCEPLSDERNTDD